MATAKFDTLAAANELQAAGIAAAHAEAIVNTAGLAVDGLLTESRFEAAMDKMRADFREQHSCLEQGLAGQTAALQALRGDMEQGLAQQTAALQVLRGDMEQGLAGQTAALQVLRHEMEAGLAKQAAALEAGLAKQASALDTGLARQTAALARFEGEIYRYLWVQGGSIIVILSSLYMLAESLARP